MLMIYSTFQAYCHSRNSGEFSLHATQWWYLTILATALGFTNHMSTMFFLPGVAYAFLRSHSMNVKTVKRFALFVLFGSFVISLLYMSLYWRAQDLKTLLIWGKPDSLEKLWDHVSGNQYAGLLFESKQITEFNLLNFGKSIPFEFAFGGLLFCAAGIVFVWKNMRRLFIFFGLSIIFNLAVALNYNIRDIFTYYLLTYIILAMIGGIGVYALLFWTWKKYVLKAIAILVIAIVIGVQSYLNWGVSHHNLYTYEDYCKAILNNVEQNAIIFSSPIADWDIFFSQAMYFQYVEGLRNDVILLEGGMLKADWFYDQIEKKHNRFFGSVEKKHEVFKQALNTFIRTRTMEDGKTYRRAYDALLTDIIAQNAGTRPIYFTSSFVQNDFKIEEITLPKGYSLVPDFLLFKVSLDTAFIPLTVEKPYIRLPEYRNAYIKTVELSISNVLLSRAFSYDVHYKRKEESDRIVRLVRSLCPDVPLPVSVSERH
jgi:hypothetical protein